MLVALACGTGCPGDDVPEVTTEGDSTGTTTGNTSGSPTSVTVTITETASDTDTDPGMTGDSGDTGDTGDTDSADTTEGMDTTMGGDDCGNGMVDGDEACDGDDLGGADCASEGFDEGELSCNKDCTLNTDACIMYSCGDDTIQGMEFCDGTDLPETDCATQEYVVGQNYDGGDLACNERCSAYDVSGCYVCGDDTIGGPEMCDGADLGGEDCVSQGFGGGTLACNADCGGFDTSGCYQEVCNMPAAPIGPDGGSLTVDTVTLAMAPGEFLADVDIVMDANHTYLGDLDIFIGHVGTGAVRQLFDQDCGTDEDIMATFDQSAPALPACGGPPGISGDVLPVESLDALVGMPDPGGDWEIAILDNFGGDGGTLNNWCVRYETTAMDPVVCGDGTINFGEDCEGMDLGGADCISVGAVGGTLACDGMCQFDTSMCDAGILLLGDDTTDPAEWDVYRNGLAATGRIWDEWNLDTAGAFPTVMELDQYHTVIWFDEGTVFPWADAEAQVINDWLTSDFDHNLFATCVDFLWDFATAPAMSGENDLYLLWEVFYAGDFAGATIPTIDGVMGDPIGGDFVAPGGLVLSMDTNSNGDWVDPAMGGLSTSAGVYAPGGGEPGAGGTALTHYDAGFYQVVWLGVNFHAGLADAAQRDQLLSNIMDYFGV